ncbi:MAG: hypothetical protein H7145_10990 [Akkermansiaceae bacterium]|nr:hypothetical protein [Armatimonadota bacterium]
MIEQQEKSGDYGAAIRGDEATAAWSGQADLGGTGARSYPIDTMNRFALILGGVLLVALVLLCFRLAYDGVKTGAENAGLTNRAYLAGEPDVYNGPRTPAGAGNASLDASRSASQPGVQSPVNFPAPALPVAARQPIFMSDIERARVSDLLSDCRAAYDASGEVSQKWFAAVGAVRAVETLNRDDIRAVGTDTNISRPLSGKEWNSIDTQIEGISATVALATQPARYPLALQETSIGLRREMQVYLQTARTALVQSDPQKRSQIQARANLHRQKAGQLLDTLESAVKGDTDRSGTGE